MKTPGETLEQELEEWYALIAKNIINTNQTGEECVACTVMRHRVGDSSAEDPHLLTEGQQWDAACFTGCFSSCYPNSRMG